MSVPERLKDHIHDWSGPLSQRLELYKSQARIPEKNYLYRNGSRLSTDCLIEHILSHEGLALVIQGAWWLTKKDCPYLCHWIHSLGQGYPLL